MISSLMPRCKTCGTSLIEKATQRKPSQLQKAYYYRAYYYCPQCRKIYHNDAFKVINESVNLFTNSNLSPTLIDVEIWTDGACSYNGYVNAKAAWAFVSGDYEEGGLVEGKQTNNTAEALAVYHALVWASKKNYKHIKIYSDSQITLHNLQKEVSRVKANQDIFLKIADVITENNLVISLEKVLGHSGDPNNERADKLANGLVGIK